MRGQIRFGLAATVAVVVSFMGSTARGDITNWNLWDPAGDQVALSPSNWQNVEGSDYSVMLSGTDTGAGVVDGSFTTDSDLDPSLFLSNSVVNDSACAVVGVSSGGGAEQSVYAVEHRGDDAGGLDVYVGCGNVECDRPIRRAVRADSKLLGSGQCCAVGDICVAI